MVTEPEKASAPPVCGRSEPYICGKLGDPQEVMVREIVGRVAAKWHLWTLHILWQSDVPVRFARLLERVPGISQKMLTQTLRDLERDGLVTRTVYAEVPPRVEYTTTDDGREIMERFAPFWQWIACKTPNVESARVRYDAKSKKPAPPGDAR